jgi:hypothetical protein
MDNISWQAPQYIYKEKTPDWYWIVGIVTISITLVAIILNNLIFGILIIISSFTLSLFASRKPEIVTMEINGVGINTSKTDHPYTTLDSFWVETRDRHPRIILKSKKTLSQYIVILIENADPEQIRHKLSEHLPEEEHVEPILEKLLIYFGF